MSKKMSEQERQSIKQQVAESYIATMKIAKQVAADLFGPGKIDPETVFGVYERIPDNEASAADHKEARADLLLAKETAAKNFPGAVTPAVVFGTWDHLFDDGE